MYGFKSTYSKLMHYLIKYLMHYTKVVTPTQIFVFSTKKINY